MDFSLLFLAFAVLWKSSLCMRCYFCEPEESFMGKPQCLEFDGSKRFVMDCPYSSMCYYKETAMTNMEEGSKSVTRGCALQSRVDEPIKENDKWSYQRNIHEIYEEGCTDDSAESGRRTRTTECYCRGDLCNDATRFRSELYRLEQHRSWLKRQRTDRPPLPLPQTEPPNNAASGTLRIALLLQFFIIILIILVTPIIWYL